MSSAGETTKVATGEPGWKYPEAGDDPAPRGEKLLVLTTGGCAVMSQWDDEDDLLAYSRLPKRDRAKEAFIAKSRAS